MDIGWPEILIIAIVVLVLFGSRKLPDAARSLGKSMRILKTEIKDLHEDDKPAAGGQQPQQLPAGSPAPAVTVEGTQPATTVGERPDSR